MLYLIMLYNINLPYIIDYPKPTQKEIQEQRIKDENHFKYLDSMINR